MPEDPPRMLGLMAESDAYAFCCERCDEARKVNGAVAAAWAQAAAGYLIVMRLTEIIEVLESRVPDA